MLGIWGFLTLCRGEADGGLVRHGVDGGFRVIGRNGKSFVGGPP
jgi:hypothetical protein